MDLFERWPGEGYADHDHGNDALRDALAGLFAERTRAEWVAFFLEHDVAGAPVYEAGETFADPHFASRALWLDAERHGVPLLGSPVRVDDAMAVAERAAPASGADTDALLRDVLGYDEARVAELRASGALGDAS